MNSIIQLNQSVAIGNLQSYTHWVNQIPLLSLEEEQDLAHRWYEHQDLEAAKRLTLSHLRFVVRVARGYLGYGLPLADLIQEGNIGLMKAVKRFDPAFGVRLVTFAVHWVKAEMHDYILKNWRIVKVATTKAQRKLFFKLRSAKKRLGWMGREEVEGVAKDLGVAPKDVLEMEARLNAHDSAFDGYDTSDEDGSGAPKQFVPALYLENKSRESDPALFLENQTYKTQSEKALYRALNSLDPRSRDILESRWFAEDKLTLHDLAAKYKVSAERIRQIEQSAMKKLKAQISVE